MKLSPIEFTDVQGSQWRRFERVTSVSNWRCISDFRGSAAPAKNPVDDLRLVARQAELGHGEAKQVMADFIAWRLEQ